HRQRFGALLGSKAVTVRVQFNVFSKGIHYGTKYTINWEKLQRFASQAKGLRSVRKLIGIDTTDAGFCRRSIFRKQRQCHEREQGISFHPVHLPEVSDPGTVTAETVFIVLVADQVIKRLVVLPLITMVDARHAFERKGAAALGQGVGIVLEAFENAFVEVQIMLLARDVVGDE